MTDPAYNEKSAEEFEKRLLEIAHAATAKVAENYKRHNRTALNGLEKVKLLENVLNELDVLRNGGPH